MNTLVRFTLVAAAAPALTAVAQPTQLWMQEIGSSGRDEAHALTPDGAGGVFIAGNTFGSLAAPSAGLRDVWLGRYDGNGRPIWLRQFGTARWDYAEALAPDDAGGFYIGGQSDGSLGGPTAGSVDAWLARYDSAGNRIWIRQFGATFHDPLHSLAPDGSGGVYGAGSSSIAPGHSDAWLVRYDGAGSQLWLRQFGSGGRDAARAVINDGAGGAFVGGGASAGGDTWLARYDSAGSQIWLIRFGTPAGETLHLMAPDDSGGIYLAGGVPGGSDAADIWVARYDGVGNEIWRRQFGSPEPEHPNGIAPDGFGGVLLGGSTWGELGGSSAGDSDPWLTRFNSAGDQLWVHQFGTADNDQGLALAAAEPGGFFFAGYRYWQVPGEAKADAWLARFADTTCSADCDASGGLDFFDFLCFQNRFATGDPRADCDGSTTLDFFDFLCFQNAFAAGCP